MNGESFRLATGSATALREAFDRSFTLAPATSAGAGWDILAVRVAGQPFAVALAEIAGLYSHRPVTPSIARAPHLLGLAGFRGKVAAVYDLAGLLGFERPADPRWLVLTPAPVVVALAFDNLEGHERVPAAAEGTMVQARGGLRRLIRIPEVLAEIGRGRR